MERKLATVERILGIVPIEGADQIESAKIRGWNVVVKKGEYKVGDLCVYCEIDSVLPDKPEFEFLRNRKFRIKTIKLKGQISQGIVFPLSVLPEGTEIKEGVDVTDVLNIKKYDPTEGSPVASMAKDFRGNFPSFIPKTDEERIQNIAGLVFAEYEDLDYYVTEKLDGSSCTMYLKDNYFGVCSRNIDLIENPENVFWRIAKENDIEATLRSIGRDMAIQGEVIGPGIQKNKYKLSYHAFKVFNIYDIKLGKYLNYNDFIDACTEFNLDMVPIISSTYRLPDKLEDLISFADGTSELNKSAMREGLVIRSKRNLPLGGRISFKVISNKYLLKEE